MSDTASTEIRETPSDEEVLAKLKRSIESLCDGVIMWSRSAYTARRTAHHIFINGVDLPEGDCYEQFVDLDLPDLAERQLITIRAYRQTFPQDVGLVWRCEPEVRVTEEGHLRLYTRLCFEPSLTKVAQGVWVENHVVGRPR